MRDLPPEIQALLARRDGIIVHQLFLISARNRTTNAMEQIGIWSGMDHKEFVIEGQSHTFYGAGNFIGVAPMKTETGLNIRKLSVTLSPFSTEMQLVLRQYDPKFAPFAMYLAFYDPATNNMVADPWRAFKGWTDGAPIRQSAKGDTDSQAALSIVGHTRILTRVIPSKRSNETQKRRLITDTFFNMVSMTGTIITPWGSKDVGSSGGGIRGLIDRAGKR